MLTPRGTPLRTFMLVVAPLLAVTVIAVATFAQTLPQPAPDKPADQPKAADPSDRMAGQIREKLSSQGFSKIEILPASYLVSAKDKEGNSFLLLIAPDQTTVLALERSALDNDADGSGPSTAENPDRSTDKDKPIFQ